MQWSGFREFLALSIPGLFMMCFEWWAFEVLAVLAGMLPDANTSLAAHAVWFNTSVHLLLLLCPTFWLWLEKAENIDDVHQNLARIKELTMEDLELSNYKPNWENMYAPQGPYSSSFLLGFFCYLSYLRTNYVRPGIGLYVPVPR